MARENFSIGAFYKLILNYFSKDLISIGNIRVLFMISERKFKELEVIVKFHQYYSIFLANSRSRSLYAVARPSVICLSVTLVRPTQAVEIFPNISAAFGTLAIR